MAEGESEARPQAVVAVVEAVVRLLASWETSKLAGTELATAVLDVERSLNVLHALSAVVLDEFDRDGAWAADGALSATQWTAERTGTSPAVLRSRLRQGQAMRLLPELAALARAGRLSPEHLRAPADCALRHPERAAQDERLFTHQAEALDADRFRVMARRWSKEVANAEAAGALADEVGRETRSAIDVELPTARPTVSDHIRAPERATEATSRLHLSRTVEGCLRLDGWFVAADADLVDAALNAGVDRQLRAAADGDPSLAGRPACTLRAGALLDLIAQSMRREPSEFSVPDRYRVAVVVRAGEGASPPEACCDAVAYRATLDAAGEVLDIGRQSARWPTGIRRAITLRDRGCIFPGCDRPPSWADIHHCTPFGKGGKTSVDNGALLCRRHHTFLHARHWRVTIENGTPVVRRPDGQPHIIHRWRPSGEGNRPPPLSDPSPPPSPI
jgi:hypothetical protein